MDCLIVHCGLLAGSCTNGEINHLVGSYCTTGTLPSYKKSYSPYQQSDGSYTFVLNNSMVLPGVFSVDQNIWLTGGKLSLTSSLNAKAAVTTANSNLNAKMFQLRAFLDSSEEVTLQPVLPESVPDLSINYDRLLQKALERNAFAQNIRRRQLEADYEVATAKGNLRSVDLFASVGYSGLDHTLSSAYKVLKDNSVVEVGVKIPILDWGKVKVAQSNREVIKAEKKAYEKVIRMIAHEVNNTTAGITSTLDTLEQAFSTQEDSAELTEVLRVCIDRCFSMSHFITRFADVVKIPDPSFSPTDLNEILTSCVRFMQGMCNERNIQILSKFEKMPLLMVDGALFEQVLLNIIKNAAESIGQEGVITITTSGNGDIEIADNGKGISKEVEDKLFSPFFSTKPNGQGIGLILIREILTRHGCTFSLRTYHDGITRFRIHFSQ